MILLVWTPLLAVALLALGIALKHELDDRSTDREMLRNRELWKREHRLWVRDGKRDSEAQS